MHPAKLILIKESTVQESPPACCHMPILEDFNQLIRKVNIIILPRTLHIVMYDINLGVAVFQFTRISRFIEQSQGHPSKLLASAQVMQFLPYRHF